MAVNGRPWPYLLLFGVLGFLVSAIDAPAQASFQAQGFLRVTDDASQSTAVSGSGQVVVGESGLGGVFEAYYWTSAGGMVGIGDIPGSGANSVAYGVSYDGAVIVGQGEGASSSREAFRWTSAGGMVSLGDFAGGLIFSRSYGVSADGSTVVGFGTTATSTEAFVWTSAGGMVSLGDFAGGATTSQARAVSSDGSVIVGFGTSGSGTEAFLWTSAGGMISLGDLAGGSVNSIAYSTSTDGSVVVGRGSTGAGNRAFVWTSAGGMVDMGSGLFYDVSGDGAIAVGQGLVANEATIWDSANGMRLVEDVLLNDYGINIATYGFTRLDASLSISQDGRVLSGWGTNGSGSKEGWIAVIPEPTTWILLIIGLALAPIVRPQCRKRTNAFALVRLPGARNR